MKKIILAMIICFGIFISGEKSSEASELYDVIYQNILYCNGDVTESQRIAEAIFYASAKCEVDPILITSVMEAESNFHFDSYSKAGAIGLMQIMPETAQAVGINPYDFFENILGGVIYLGEQIKKFSSWGEYGITYAVAAYNAGPGAVEKFGGVPNYAETQNYVVTVAKNYNKILKKLS